MLFDQIADRLDEVGQRFRILQLLRGLVLFLGSALVVAVAAALLASATGAGRLSQVTLIAVCIWLLGSAIVWVGRPLIIRPTTVQMARLVESRIPDLHNGLTNAVLLADRPDVQDSPFLSSIYDEVIRSSETLPLNDAVSTAQLRPLAVCMGVAAGAALIVGLIASSAVARGFQQMLRPSQFIPTVSNARLIEVKPGDITLVAGQPLEISILAEDTRPNEAHLIFDDDTAPITLMPTATVGSTPNNLTGPITQSYAYRQDHADHSLRYRVEVGGTQSPWYRVNVVKEVKLEQLSLSVAPPAYAAAHFSATTINLTADTIDKTPVAVPVCSHLAVNLSIDVPSTGAMLQLADDEPIAMTASREGKSFAGKFDLPRDTPMSILLTQGSGQVIARLPAQPLMIRAKPDAPPVIEMKWPTQDLSLAPDASLIVKATLKDDYGLTNAQVYLATTADGELKSVHDVHFNDNSTQAD
ncbi:MAG: DUF4175 family protein, partial [Phycisphaerae bacterium]|nr:DUF4175 family protein [Phycisphaerae bacterium]